MAPSNQAGTGRGWTTKQMVWACLGSLGVGAILTYQAGFNWGGSWETGDAVQKRLAVSACVQQFLLQPDRSVIDATLKDTSSSYQRRQMIENQELASDVKVADASDTLIREFEPTLFPAA